MFICGSCEERADKYYPVVLSYRDATIHLVFCTFKCTNVKFDKCQCHVGHFASTVLWQHGSANKCKTFTLYSCVHTLEMAVNTCILTVNENIVTKYIKHIFHR